MWLSSSPEGRVELLRDPLLPALRDVSEVADRLGTVRVARWRFSPPVRVVPRPLSSNLDVKVRPLALPLQPGAVVAAILLDVVEMTRPRMSLQDRISYVADFGAGFRGFDLAEIMRARELGPPVPRGVPPSQMLDHTRNVPTDPQPGGPAH
jgi:hypothetical protein